MNARMPAQALVALDRANATIVHRAAVKRDLRAGRRTPTDLILDPHPLEETWRITKVLEAIPSVRKRDADLILASMRFSALATLGRLTMRQRLELAGRLRDLDAADV